jgi:Asp-tRNA(Asn)/Glu-tRNA(Gln) amidotransferase A subunit family amidase
MTTLHELSATVLASLYRNRAASPVEVTRAVLAHIGHWEPLLNATYALDPEAAMAMARASEQRWHHGEPLGPLDGVPVTIKENIATAGVPVPLGSAATTLQPALADAPPAARLREGGAVLLGKTTMPDLGMLSSGLSSFHPLTRNPWDLGRNPGGSSAGAAAACAAGYGPLHLGTDIGGSIRLPAGWCGVVGFKPSLGRVPIQPPYAGRVAGPITRTVADAALMMGVLSQPDWRDGTALPGQAIAWSALERPLKGLKVGLWLDAGWGLPPEPQTEAAVRRAADRLQAEGAVIEPLAPFTTRAMVDGLDRFWRMRAWLDLQALPAGRRHRVLPYIRDWAATAQGYSGAQVFEGFSQMAAIRDATLAATRAFDVVLSPVAPVLPFAAEAASPLDDPARPFEHIGYTLPFNFSEQPAIALPAGWSADGLPIGLQIAGRRHDDLGVLQVAHAWERLAPRRAWPEAPLDG